MHEEALLKDLRRKLLEITQREGNPPVRRVRLRVGALSHVTPESLQRRWPEVVDGTSARGALLEVEVADDAADPSAQSIRLVELTVDDGERSTDPPTASSMAPS
ncbi:MAG: hydrogenase/urease maturation nickel metallochaperone HypA [Thermoplasmata archaeon]